MNKKNFFKGETGKVFIIMLVLCALAFAVVIGLAASGLEPNPNNDFDYICYIPY